MSDAPPSFSQGAAPAVAFTQPGGSLSVPPRGSAVVHFGVKEEARQVGPRSVANVSWRAVPSAGVTVSPSTGTLRVAHGRSTTPLRVTTAVSGTATVTFDLSQGATPLPSLTLDVSS